MFPHPTTKVGLFDVFYRKVEDGHNIFSQLQSLKREIKILLSGFSHDSRLLYLLLMSEAMAHWNRIFVFMAKKFHGLLQARVGHPMYLKKILISLCLERQA